MRRSRTAVPRLAAFGILIALVGTLFAPALSTAQEEPRRRSTSPAVSIGGGDVHVAQDEYLKEVVVVGGNAEIHGVVHKDVVLIASRAKITGRVNGSVVCVMSKVELGPQAQIGGELVNVLGDVEIPPTVTIGREFINIPIVNLSHFATGNIITFLLWLFLWIKLLKIAGLLLVVILFVVIFSGRIDLAAEALPVAWGRSLLYGLLLFVLVPALCIMLVLSVIGIPIAVLLGFAVKVLTWFGLAGVFCALGQSIGRNVLGRSLSTFGATMLGFLVAAIVYVVPVLGGIFLWLLGTLGLGLTIVTRFGGRMPLPETPGAPSPGAHPSAPPIPPGPPVAGGGPPPSPDPVSRRTLDGPGGSTSPAVTPRRPGDPS